MRHDARRVLVAYDVPDDRRRTKIAALLQRYGDRVQYSVFIVDAAPIRLARLQRELAIAMVPSQDSVLICDLGLVSKCGDHNFTWLGRTRPVTDEDSFVI